MTDPWRRTIGDAPPMDLSRLGDVFRPSDFTEPVSCEHAAMYADAVVHLLAQGGLEQISMTAAARWMGQVPSAVKQRSGGRDGFLRMVTARFGRRWLRWVSLPARDLGTLVRLPDGDDEVHGVRAWSALCEVAAGEARSGKPELAAIIAAIRRRHRECVEDNLQFVLDRPPTAVEIALVDHLGEALRAAVAAPVDPLDPAAAASVVAWVTERLSRSD